LKEDILYEAYHRVWDNAFKIATELGFSAIAVNALGSGAFNPYGRDKRKFMETFHNKIIKSLKEKYKINVLKMGETDVPDKIEGIIDSYSPGKILWTNAWDPWSILGNGNSKDNSLDGYWGRSSAIAVLGWPATNPFITYKPI
jgi:hypothetical protein